MKLIIATQTYKGAETERAFIKEDSSKYHKFMDINIISIGDLFDRIVIFVSCSINKNKWG